jgi:predicted ATPase
MIGSDSGSSHHPHQRGKGEGRGGCAPFQQFVLCDRESEALQLRQAFDRGCLDNPDDAAPTPGSPPCQQDADREGGGGELVLVTGPSGCGKTCLVESVVRSTLMRVDGRNEDDDEDCSRASGRHNSNTSNGKDSTDTSGVLICGKFDQLERREQYYAIVQALTEYALILLRGSSASTLRKMRSAMKAQETVRIVAELVPELQPLLDFDDASDDEGCQQTAYANPHNEAALHRRTATKSSPEGGTLARERLQLGLRRFFSTTCSSATPVVLFLDDLQWAEPASLDLLASLFTDRIPGLVLIGACRDNEVDPASYLCVILRELESRNVRITQVIVSNVGESAIVSALGDSFGAGSAKAAALARILYEHTAGNMFFVTQLVRYLVGEGVIYKPRDSKSGLWSYASEESIRTAIRAATDEVELMAIVIQKQDPKVRDVLMVASCLGAEFSEFVLRAAVTFDVAESLHMAEQMAFLKRSAHDRHTWRFVHDRIQESAYTLIPIYEREQVHLRIGRNLWTSLAEPELDAHAHVVVKQLRLGVRLITAPSERELLATLLLRAGEMAARASAHVTAQEYVTLGITLLESRHWRDQYSLSLALHDAAAEIEYCLANFERTDALFGEIMTHARSAKDMIRSRMARVLSLGSRNKLDEAIEVGLETLKNIFGERLPSQPSAFAMLVELKKTRRLLRGHSDDSLMSLPSMTDFQTLASIRIMSILIMYAVLARPKLAPVLAMRIVQHSIRRGLCGMSGAGFVYYGIALTLFCNDVETGIRYGAVALRIVERFDAMDQLAKVSTAAHCFCLAYTEPLQSFLQPLRLAHRVGLGSGDIEHSLLAAGMYAMVAVHTSRPLSLLATDLESFFTLTAAYRQSNFDVLFRPLAQFVQCLLGQASDPSKLSGTYLDWEEALRVAVESNHSAAVSMILSCKLMLECLFRKLDDAEGTAHRLTQPGCTRETAPCFMRAEVWLYRGLACTALAHKDGVIFRRRIREAKICHRQLSGLRRYSEHNYGGKTLLLGAEILAASGSYHQALLEYDASVTASRSAEAWSDAGLACERLSSALQAKGRFDESLIYLNQASRYYEMWGAAAKVAELQSAILQKRKLQPSSSAGPER